MTGGGGTPVRAEDSAASAIERLVATLARLPGLGPRSARRAALHLLENRASHLVPLARALEESASVVRRCESCGNYSAGPQCGICADPARSMESICVVEHVADLWAMERSEAFRGRYHVLGGTLSAVTGVRPEDLGIPRLAERVGGEVKEVILALNGTFDGETTAHYIAERLVDSGVRITRIGCGVPVGGELDYLDGDTIAAAFRSRLEA